MKERDSGPQNGDLFRQPLSDMVDPAHPLVLLSRLIDWGSFERAWAGFFPSHTGRPALPARLVAGLMYLQHANRMSDEVVVRTWLENIYWQYFCGMEHWQRHAPMDASSLVRWRRRIGKAGGELMLQETINVAKRCKVMKRTGPKRVAVDTTVMEKAVEFPTDAGLLEAGRRSLVSAAGREGLSLRQNYNRTCPRLYLKACRHAHAKQYGRMQACVSKIRNRLGRVCRDVSRQLGKVVEASSRTRLEELLSRAGKLLEQGRHSKGKVYSFHAPEVECIGKGKARNKYQFGCKVSGGVDLDSGIVVGMKSCPGNPYDGHTLSGALEQIRRLCGTSPQEVHVDRGYRGHGVDEEGVTVCVAGSRKDVAKAMRKRQKLRNKVESAFGHMKVDGRLGRNTLSGTDGDAIFAVLCGCGHNVRLLLSRIRDFFAPRSRDAILALFRLFFRLSPAFN